MFLITIYHYKSQLYCFRTPFHADVFRSFSWSANICGRKKWIFYPPGEYYEDISVIQTCTVHSKISLLHYKAATLQSTGVGSLLPKN